MCQRLRDILFPTNILGKDKRTIKYSLADTPIDGGGYKNITMTWSGKRLEFVYTERLEDVNTGEVKYQPVTLVEINQEAEKWVEDIDFGTHDGFIHSAVGDMLYLKCTDVTTLIVNGQKLI